MSNKRSITILIGIIGVLLLMLAGTIGYILGNANENGSTSTGISDDKKVMQEIEELKQMYDSKIAEKTNNYNALEAAVSYTHLDVYKRQQLYFENFLQSRW